MMKAAKKRNKTKSIDIKTQKLNKPNKNNMVKKAIKK